MTITDVARAAGVSVATVSRALRGLDGVRPQTRARVQEAARALDYVASPTAISLASGRTRTVGVVTPVLTRWQFAALVSSIERTVRDHGYHALLLDLLDSPASVPVGAGIGSPGPRTRRRPLTGPAEPTGPARLRLTRDMLWRRVDGLITLDLALTEPEVALVRRLGLPLITIGHPVPGWDAVRSDPVGVIAAAVDHLRRLGHVDIAYVATVPGSSVEVHQNLEAFVTVMRRHGLRVPRSWLLASGATAGNAAQVTLPLLSGEQPPTAIVAGCDEIAIGVLAAARRSRLRVPQDLSVVGVGDHAFADALGLTTIRQDLDSQGQVAASLLLARIADPPDPRDAETVVVPSGLVVRESTAAPRRACARTEPAPRSDGRAGVQASVEANGEADPG